MCKCLRSVNLSYNKISIVDLKELLNNCSLIERLSLVNALNSSFSNNSDACDLMYKKQLISNNALKYFKFNFETQNDFNLIKSIFIQKWSHCLHIAFRTVNIIEFFT